MKKYLGKKNLKYIHKVFHIGFIRIAFFKLGRRWTIRIEINKGWI